MPGPLENQHDTPRPPATRSSPRPGLLSAVFALVAGVGCLLRANDGGRSAVLAAAAVGGGFFLGRRLGGARAGLLTAAVLAAMTVGFAFGRMALPVIFLAVTGAWWALRYRDDRAPANGLVALAALIGLGWLAAHGTW